MNIRPNRFPVVSADAAALVAGEHDAGLLRIIGEERRKDQELADAALAELYRRHVEFLYPLCCRVCSVYLSDSSQAENLLARTMWGVYKNAEKFDPARARCADDAACVSRAVRLWIARRARWLAKDIAQTAAASDRRVVREPELLDQVAEESDETVELDDEVVAALRRLPERERHVVLAHYLFTDSETGRLIPPEENIDAYCARRWGTTAANIRKIRSRALESLKEWLTPSASPAAARR